MQCLSDVIAYAVNEEKTRRKGKKGEEEIANETEQIMQQYVSGINCTPATARSEMMAVKKGTERTRDHGFSWVSVLCSGRVYPGNGP